ncbi:3-phosphoshikimate 1-carboxyvinyltransferase [Lachnoanaerobaculum sp. OBRC5-5]|uniref:3-phosphoshikimate 1-carboxyvinyltransferase n=1 Tax=Lachnoanaerobaculum sp. OBRC5-5 TaxID=936595 RepID=UPI00028251CA|nr:3-phosphoshikimate 1-carboxyvinyltransferase [Lachnoanaerobaculum sp. OBRC5-5]EJZ71104.1 3-phosphoshikimate 1-carboxyvinyltransferase [Lachnoanaerobaculum sp. OBRC5-5]
MIKGRLRVPGDKSISHRAVMFGAISKGITNIKGFLTGADCISTISIFKKMGIDIEINNTDVTVKGKGLYGLSKPGEILDCGNSGTTTRLVSGILSAQNFTSVLTGDKSIQKRPMNRIIVPLTLMGANIKSNNGFAPLTITGSSLHGIEYNSPVASAQVKSAILLAGLYSDSPTTVIEPAKSRDHTELMLKKFGANLNTTKTSATINPCKELFATGIDVPSDISSAAFFMAAAVLVPGSELILENVGINPTRDGVIKVLKDMGANIEIINSNDEFEPVADIKVSYSKLHATTIGGDIIPTLIDELPLLAAIASLAEGKTIIKDAAELKVKESNRIKVMCEELSKLGVNVVETEDGMEIEGTNKLFGNVTISTHDDHRIAMTFAILGLISEGEIKLDNKACVEISYPEFFDDLRKVNI